MTGQGRGGLAPRMCERAKSKIVSLNIHTNVHTKEYTLSYTANYLRSHVFHISIQVLGAGEVAQRLRTIVAFAGKLVLIPRV